MRYVTLGAFGFAAMLGTASADRYHPSANEPPFTAGWAAPLVRVEPSYGRPGTEVRLTGVTFHRGVQCFFGDQPMPILAASERELLAFVPFGAHGQNYIFVIDDKGHERTDDIFVIERRHGSHYHRW